MAVLKDKQSWQTKKNKIEKTKKAEFINKKEGIMTYQRNTKNHMRQLWKVISQQMDNLKKIEKF